MHAPTHEHAQVKVAPPLLFAAFLAAALLANWVLPLPSPWLLPTRVLGGLLLAAGFLLAASAVAQMLRAHTSPDPYEAVAALVTGGPYQFTRNPIYLGFLLLYLGLAFLVGTLWAVLLSPFLIWTVMRAVIRPEEEYLEHRFGSEYLAYRARVRRWI